MAKYSQTFLDKISRNREIFKTFRRQSHNKRVLKNYFGDKLAEKIYPTKTDNILPMNLKCKHKSEIDMFFAQCNERILRTKTHLEKIKKNIENLNKDRNVKK